MSVAEPGAYQSTAERFGPRRDPAARAILAGVDGSDTAMRAAAFAFGLARRQDSSLIVVFVACPAPLGPLRPAVATVIDHDTAAHLYAELRDQTRSAAEELQVPVTLVKTFGDPFTALRDTADRARADTVVVGASQKAGHRFAGSVATKLIRAGHWPVLVVP
ncbi:universal stress protein [Amycolatopsis australiensis]|uniref:Nucleotide-binding universal stress protein, UspA family n=1 Tax=Amycolatopsis australiensis TaxID=546364 RepID=A0A1K1SN79_9PSEU|nr:universal stress protein [Amycolatopsis australiensis]SFW85535.1 Nucleotide-binding universal stress protein, UspA family [Amycolatopsis australiensis]